MNWPRPSVVLRWVLGALLGGGGLFVLVRLAHGEGAVPLIGRSLFGLAALIAGVVLVTPELVPWAVSPLSRLLDSVLLPSETVEPPVDFKLARFYGENLRYDEACEEYERILHYHPESTAAYLEGIRAAGLAGNERRAKKLYQRARRVLRSAKERRLLDAVYAARNQPFVPPEATDPEESSEGTGDAASEPPPPDRDAAPTEREA